ncbi:MAG: cell division protein SepF [Candidatus Methanoplasma sp.]|jgi:SepF-like predicted cell division protein (DUF552 family)|nr:cell division protein SepF [Candidatus Methanoplasma sp.]
MFGRKKKEEKKEKIFIDLDGHPSASAPRPQSDAGVKFIEIMVYNDLKPIVDMAYRGNILVLDFSRFADGDQSKKEIARYLAGISKDTSGAFTEVSERLMILTPGGWGIDRIRISHKER